jgi:hypothetical protein
MVCRNNEQADTARERRVGATIKAYIKTWNKSGRRFIWMKGADELLAKSNKATSISSNV